MELLVQVMTTNTKTYFHQEALYPKCTALEIICQRSKNVKVKPFWSCFSEWLNPEQTEEGVQVQAVLPWLISIVLVCMCV